MILPVELLRVKAWESDKHSFYMIYMVYSILVESILYPFYSGLELISYCFVISWSGIVLAVLSQE